MSARRCAIRVPDADAPASLPGLFRLSGGAAVTVRAIDPRKADRLQGYVRSLSTDSRRNRFLGAISELAASELERLSRMQGPGELTLVVVAGNGAGPIVAEAVQVVARDSGRCEIALSVAEAWRRQGLGTLLLTQMESRAHRLGARYLIGDVLRTNTAMKNLARKAGFSIRTPFTDARLVEIIKELPLAALTFPL